MNPRSAFLLQWTNFEASGTVAPVLLPHQLEGYMDTRGSLAFFQATASLITASPPLHSQDSQSSQVGFRMPDRASRGLGLWLEG